MRTGTVVKESASAVDVQPLDSVFGRIHDVDSHEMIPAVRFVKEYGDVAEPIARIAMLTHENAPNSQSALIEQDDKPMIKGDLESYWTKGCFAPSAFDMKRRLEFMDMIGVQDTLVFGSGMYFFGQQLATDGGQYLRQRGTPHLPPVEEAFALGKKLVRAHNDWCIGVGRISPRLRPVGSLMLGQSLKEMMEEAERLIANGIRAVAVVVGEPIDGKAPAHPDIDPLWALLARHKIPLTLHTGSEKTFVRKADEWVNAPQFGVSFNTPPSETANDPFSLATNSFAAQAYIMNLTLGGVFERFPDLYVGVLELGAQWVGPVAENMDVWVDKFARRFAGLLSMKPSEYVQRNVRVSPFNFEPVDRYIERFPFLENVYCFSTDYPHWEGLTAPDELLANRIQRLGSSVIEKFFVTNAECLMPS